MTEQKCRFLKAASGLGVGHGWRGSTGGGLSLQGGYPVTQGEGSEKVGMNLGGGGERRLKPGRREGDTKV